MSENEIVRAFNNYLTKGMTKYDGIAFRRKQHRFTSQFCDIILSSPDIKHLAIEHKSWKLDNSGKLYWSQHFSSETEDDFLEETHQIHRVHEFADRAGMKPILAVEMSRGPGRPRSLFFVDWTDVRQNFINYNDDEKDEGLPGLSPEWLEENCLYETRVSGGEYEIHAELIENLVKS